jgi:enoyl-CoA hydratase/carnithine racemase
MAMDYEQITTETSDGVLTITLNRPERPNAWTTQMGGELRSAFDRA